MSGKILIGDVLEKIKEIPDESVDCIITSPPYWGLRDYGTGRWEGGDPNCDHSAIRHKTREERGGLTELQAGSKGGFGDEKKWTSDICPTCNAKRIDPQWGLEMDFHDYLDKLDKLMDECRRVLKKTGTCWVNLGDTYASGGGASRHYGHGQYEDPKYGNDKGGKFVDPQTYPQGVTTKSRMGIPERFYIRCIDKGWVARNHIPWIKANSMPSSVRDRFTNKWESIFFFAKNKKYYFDLDAVRVPPKTGYGTVISKSKGKRKSLEVLKQQESMSKFGFADKHSYGLHERRERGEAVSNCNPLGKNPGDVFRDKYGNIETETKYRQGMNKERGENLVEKRNLPEQKEFVDKLRESFTVDELVQHGLTRTTVEHWFRYDDSGFAYPDVEDWRKVNTKLFPELLQVYLVTDDIDPSNRAVYDKTKPYAVVERDGVIYYRNLPKHEEIIAYLNRAKKNMGITIDQLEEMFDNYTPHHWFEKDGSYPTKEDWIKVKEILKFDDIYDEVMTKEYVKSAEKIDNPKGKNPGDVFRDSDAKTKDITSPSGSAERTLVDLNTNVERNMESRMNSILNGKNPGDVFEINTKPCKEAHFATFPPTLPEKILKCSCPKQLCKKCGKARVAIKERQIPPEDVFTNTRVKDNSGLTTGQPHHNNGKIVGKGEKYQLWLNEHPDIITGYTECGCNAGYESGVVLDPFFGAGTVGMVAEQLGLNWIGIELNSEYGEIAKKRIGNQEKITQHIT